MLTSAPGTRRLAPLLLRILAIVVIAVPVGLGARSVAATTFGQHHSKAFPQSAAMEDRLGVRFSRVAVVADGGLITLTYVVLDPEKASRFQSDVSHPPVLRSEARKESTQRVSLMKQGHTMRTGQTYYLVYQNTRAALRRGEFVDIVYADLQLRHVPVL
jgi:hypothetical protein